MCACVHESRPKANEYQYMHTALEHITFVQIKAEKMHMLTKGVDLVFTGFVYRFRLRQKSCTYWLMLYDCFVQVQIRTEEMHTLVEGVDQKFRLGQKRCTH